MSAAADALTIASSPLSLVREDLRDFAGYQSARSQRLQGSVWLNANESPWRNDADGDGSLRRYPDPQPQALREALAGLYGCAPGQLLAGRGSDEGIDLLVRAVCRPGGDAVLVTTPTFGMYAVSARLHGTRVLDVPLVEDARGWHCDFAAIAAAVRRDGVKLVFLCSPGNPTGALLPLDGIARLARELDGQALVVVDEAYLEFADAPSAISLLPAQRNVAVLRTLSKAHALAAARIGSVIADADLIDVLRRCQAPYPLPAACTAQALQALAPQVRSVTVEHIATVRGERELLRAALAELPGVRRAYDSRANFVLARFDDAQAAFDALLAAGVVVRDMRSAPGLGDALRISLGTPEQNRQVLAVLKEVLR